MLRLAAGIARSLRAPPIEPRMRHGMIEAAASPGTDFICQRQQRGQRCARS
jgi:hypothetical protein